MVKNRIKQGKRSLWVTLILFIFVFGLMGIQFSGCNSSDDSSSSSSTDNNNNNNNNNNSGNSAYEATGSVTTNSSGTIATSSGAKIFVPDGAVTPEADGSVGTTIFSIEQDTTSSPTLPSGEQIASDIYRFGPSGFVFQQAVQVTIPVKTTENLDKLTLYRINETSGDIEDIGGVYDESTKTITGQTTHFSPIFAATRSSSSSAAGCILLDNSNASAYTWRNVCPSEIIEYYYPTGQTFSGSASVSPDSCSSGFCNQIKYIVPQGRYRLCVETWSRDSQMDLPKLKGHTILPDIVDVDSPYLTGQGQSGTCAETVNLSNLVMDESGPCPCSSTPTPSVGTGGLTVTLTWHSSSAIDLDLWVTEPNGNQIDYNSPTSSTGGQLDIDNKCDNYTNGRPENIYWVTPPTGSYKIVVDWYGSCGNSISSIGYEVRVINGTNTKTYTGTITDSATITVDTITVN